ncbi:uncharacterized protein LOC125369433 isoform X2 [Ricinus communis]|uniref:uncharacterized protein LOC125369433 isoform X2 n=1 Tax=Ricinus communis TaxID=3988 RepID=UPI00077294C7|nr:uncharacterized protein LOC125369433 isoform X2 [Ricinus communis]
MLGKKTTGTTGSEEGSALAIPEAQVSSRTSQNQHAEDKSNLHCDYCGRSHHIQEKCWKLHGKPSNGRAKKSYEQNMLAANEAGSSPFSKEQLNQLLKLLKSCPSSNAPIGSMAQTGSNPLALSVLGRTTPWIIDSGASDHMTSCSSEDKSNLHCDYCGRSHHTQEKCWKLHGKPSNGRAKKSYEQNMLAANEAGSSPFSKEQLNQLLKLLKSCPSSNAPIGSMAQTGLELGEDDWNS